MWSLSNFVGQFYKQWLRGISTHLKYTYISIYIFSKLPCKICCCMFWKNSTLECRCNSTLIFTSLLHSNSAFKIILGPDCIRQYSLNAESAVWSGQRLWKQGIVLLKKLVYQCSLPDKCKTFDLEVILLDRVIRKYDLKWSKILATCNAHFFSINVLCLSGKVYIILTEITFKKITVLF